MVTPYIFVGPAPRALEAQSALAPQWLHAVSPSPEECRQLAAEQNIPLEYLQASLDSGERPRLEYTENCLLILIRASIPGPPDSEALFNTTPVAAILTPKVVVTVCPREIPLESILSGGLKGGGERFAVRLALTMLFRSSTGYIENLHHLDARMSNIEKTLRRSMQNSALVQMLHIEKSLIYFLTALKDNHAVLEKLRLFPHISLLPAERDLLDDALIENRQAVDTAEVFIQVIGSLGDAFGAIVSNNVNKVMRLLTGLTLLFMIPTTVAAIYGMNVILPFQEHPRAFALICLFCAGLSGLLLWLFWKKRWL
ncbi:MAG: magnesium transporter CorA family protein [Deltaproteobacteria bacterium]|jgi:magnesium transporter|nr:magnesium transporter CorA family protein [Deltaproteobacteria bacterium]